jgi:hypothetical protein
MITCKYLGLDGHEKTLDLDLAIDVVKGKSFKRAGWTSLIVYDPISNKFIDLCDAPADFRGNSKYVCEEISVADLMSNFSITDQEIAGVKKNPSQWRLINTADS